MCAEAKIGSRLQASALGGLCVLRCIAWDAHMGKEGNLGLFISRTCLICSHRKSSADLVCIVARSELMDPPVFAYSNALAVR